MHRNSEDYLKYKEHLIKTYNIPYFKKNIKSADYTINVDKDYGTIENEIKNIIKKL